MAAAQIPAPVNFTSGTTISSSDVNANFAAIRTAHNALIGTAGEAYIGDDANANVTLGLTINQGANDDGILALKSSDVAHGLTTYGETDTFAHFYKASATLGGLDLRVMAEDAALTSVIELRAFGGTADTTKSTAAKALVQVYAAEHDGANALANITADGNVFGVLARVGGADVMRWMVDEDGDTWQAGGATIGGTAYIGDSSNANATLGLTINQGANDDQILAFKSSDVAHGLTTGATAPVQETDDFFHIQKNSPASGGVRLTAIMEDAANDTCFQMFAFGSQAEATKTGAGRGLFEMVAWEHDGANGLANITADGNVFAVRAYVSGAVTSLFIIDEDGDFFYDGAGTAFDAEDDAALARAFALATSKDVIRTEFDDFVKYNEDDLVRLGLLGDTVANGGLVNGAQLQRLLVGAVWQQQVAIESLRSEIKALTA